MWRNTSDCYGRVSISLHWLIAAGVAALFALGLWMVGLGYYDPWYLRAPDIHRSGGILIFAAAVLQLLWRSLNPRPSALGTAFETRAATLAHWLLELCLFAVLLSGYLISTADGRAIDVFNLFSVPATLSGLDRQADIAGDLHAWLAYALIGLATVHALAALKHHLIDRDNTLGRMLRSKC